MHCTAQALVAGHMIGLLQNHVLFSTCFGMKEPYGHHLLIAAMAENMCLLYLR